MPAKMAVVTRHVSDKQHEVVQGINLISLVWNDGDAAFPYDFRPYNKAENGLSKNDHFGVLLETAQSCSFQPGLVAFNIWYSSLDNLKLVRSFGWGWLTRLKSNRQFSLQISAQQAVHKLIVPATGATVHLRGYGMVKVFRTVAPHGNVDYWAINRLSLTEAQRENLSALSWLIEVYHCVGKQFTGTERGQFRLERSSRNYIGPVLRAPPRLKYHRWHSRLSIFQSELDIVRLAAGFLGGLSRARLPSTAQLPTTRIRLHCINIFSKITSLKSEFHNYRFSRRSLVEFI